MQVVKDWLNGSRDYDEGVALYMQYGDDKDMKALFREYRTSFKEKKLVELLKGLLGKEKQVKVATATKEVKLQVETHGWPAKMKPELAALKEVWQPLYKELMNLCARLLDVARLGRQDKNKEMEAGQMALRILKLREDIKEIYCDRDHYLQHGCFPGKEQPFTPVVDDLKLAERRLTVRRYLTRLNNELAKEGKPNIRLKQEKDFARYAAEMEYINKKLKRPENEGIPTRKQQTEHSEGKDKSLPGR
jgi:hypothetical protein